MKPPPTPPAGEKTDFRRTLDRYHGKRGEFRLVVVPSTRYLMIDGHGDPNTSTAFDAAVRAVYPVAYTLKFASKRQLSRDYVVPPLEGLWWAQDMEVFTAARDKSRWDWTLMLLVPEWLPDEMVMSAVDVVSGKKDRPSRLDDVRVASLDEGQCVQTLHVGPFDQEAQVLHRMHHEIIPELGLQLRGTHHEIYLSDVRRSPPEKQRTLLRQPVGRIPGVNFEAS